MGTWLWTTLFPCRSAPTLTCQVAVNRVCGRKNPQELFEELSTEISTGRNRLPVENRCDMAAGRGSFPSSERARGVSPVTPTCLGQHGGPAAAGQQTRLSFACVFDHGGSDRPDRGSD